MAFFALLTFELIVKEIGPDNRPESYDPDTVLP